MEYLKYHKCSDLNDATSLPRPLLLTPFSGQSKGEEHCNDKNFRKIRYYSESLDLNADFEFILSFPS